MENDIPDEWELLLNNLSRGVRFASMHVTRADCRDEYNIVLHYSHLPLDDDSRPVAAARFDALVKVVAPDASLVRLPVCTDRDDQKFLEIARAARAPHHAARSMGQGAGRSCARIGIRQLRIVHS